MTYSTGRRSPAPWLSSLAALATSLAPVAAAAQAAAGVDAATVPGPPPAPAGDSGASSRAAAGSPTRSGLLVILRAGVSASGGGTVSARCEGSCFDDEETGSTSQDTGFDDESPTAVSAELAGQIGPSLRVGGGAFWVPKPTLRIDGEEIASGGEISAHGVVEGAFRVSPTTAITLRAQAGPLVLLSGRDHERNLDVLYETCLEGADRCQNRREFVGATAGAGVGVLVRAESVALRADLLAQSYAVDWSELRITVDGERATVRETAAGSRLWLMAGIEL